MSLWDRVQGGYVFWNIPLPNVRWTNIVGMMTDRLKPSDTKLAQYDFSRNTYYVDCSDSVPVFPRKLSDNGSFVLFSKTRFHERISIPRQDHNFLWILKLKVKTFLSLIMHMPWSWILSAGKTPFILVSDAWVFLPLSPGKRLCYPLYLKSSHTQSICGHTAENKNAPFGNRILVVHFLANYFSELTRLIYSLLLLPLMSF